MESFDYQAGCAMIANNVTGASRSMTVAYNLKRTMFGDNAIIVYDSDKQRNEAARRITAGTLITVEEIREGLKCVKLA